MREVNFESNRDPNLSPRYWFNDDKAQTHYFKSCLEIMIPGSKDHFPIIEVKPGTTMLIPHQYYTVHTVDGTALKGKWLVGESIGEVAPKTFRAQQAR